MEKKRKTPPGTTVRLPEPLYEEVKEAAARSGHYMNDEIILRLRLYPIAKRLDEIERQNCELKRMVQQLIYRSC